MDSALRGEAAELVDLARARIAGRLVEELRGRPLRMSTPAAVEVVATMAATMAGPGGSADDVLADLAGFVTPPRPAAA